MRRILSFTQVGGQKIVNTNRPKEVGQSTGLGLSISYGIIESHKGQIEIESKEGEGTAVLITLPIGGF